VRHIKTIQDVVDWGLCIGCGACYYARDKAAVTLVNVESVGIRPQFDSPAPLARVANVIAWASRRKETRILGARTLNFGDPCGSIAQRR